MSRVALPPYITSGASSRPHHALLVALHSSSSAQEEDAILASEIKRAREVLGGKGQSTAKIAETLLILLHVGIMRHSTGDGMEFALVSALQLAESGRTIKERRIGYLYLTEMMAVGDELGLMLINTIRKDLSSSKAPEIMLALGTIVKLPSVDLSPAVTPILTSKVLLRHKSPAVRQRTLEALAVLYQRTDQVAVEPRSFPLSMSKLIKLLCVEEDVRVFAVILRMIRDALKTGSHRFVKDTERVFVVQQVVEAARRMQVDTDGVVGMEVLKVLREAMLEGEASNDEAVEVADNWLREQLGTIRRCREWTAAFLLEACTLVTSLQLRMASSHSHELILHLISTLLLPPSSSSTSTAPPPNDHVLALRGLIALPKVTWDGFLAEEEMGVIMEGLNGPDDTIRRLTLRLLHRLSPDLLTVTFNNLLDSLSTSSDLSLPLGLPADSLIEEKLRRGRDETACRALEVAETQAAVTEKVDDSVVGQTFGEAVVQLLAALQEANREETGRVWEDGSKRVLEVVRHRSRDFSEAFTRAIFDTQMNATGSTFKVIRAILACEYAQDTQLAINGLLQDLPDGGASVQELILIALVSLLARHPNASVVVLEALRAIEGKSGKHIRKRLQQVTTIIEQNLLDILTVTAKSSSLPDMLNAMMSMQPSPSRPDPASSSPSSPAFTAGSPPLSASKLRYNAYEPPRNDSRSIYRDDRPMPASSAESRSFLSARD